MENETYWRSFKMSWGLYYIYLGQFQTPALLVDGLLFYFLSMAVSDLPTFTARAAYACLGLWIVFTKILKLIPHFCRHPADMKFIPLSIGFSYFHGFLNLFALCTMQVTGWGTQDLEMLQSIRAGTDDDSDEASLLADDEDEEERFHGPKPVICPVRLDLLAKHCLLCFFVGPKHHSH